MVKPLNLMLHCGSSVVDREQVDAVETPQATDRWCPIPHKALVDMLEHRLDNYGLRAVQSAHALYKDGARYFGMFQVEPIGGDGTPEESSQDFSMVFGLRNAHDKSFAAGLCLGSGVFVCDNLAFSAEVVIGRRHTVHIMRDLPRLVSTAVGQLFQARTDQAHRLEAYKQTEITDDQAAKLLLDAMDAKAINTTRVPKVWEQWKTPAHPEFAQDKTAWRLLNGFTEVLKDSSLVDLPPRTTRLHGLLDAMCGLHTGNLRESIGDTIEGRVVDATLN